MEIVCLDLEGVLVPGNLDCICRGNRYSGTQIKTTKRRAGL